MLKITNTRNIQNLFGHSTLQYTLDYINLSKHKSISDVLTELFEHSTASKTMKYISLIR